MGENEIIDELKILQYFLLKEKNGKLYSDVIDYIIKIYKKEREDKKDE